MFGKKNNSTRAIQMKINSSFSIRWSISFVTSIFLCGMMIYESYMRWLNAPVVINFSNEATPISDIPFPTATICNGIKVDKRILDYGYIIEKLHKHERHLTRLNLTDKQVEQMYALSTYFEVPPSLEEYVKLKNIQLD